ncbi:MAG: SDR family NAD(P)-dependent oxidoreductase [Pseudomonadota bacterium]
MSVSIEGKVALVTGGARGIGAGIVRTLVKAGARVMIADIGLAETAQDDADWRYKLASSTELAQTLEGVERSQVDTVYVDVTDAASARNAVAATLTRFGQLDILINNAGVVDSGPVGSFDEVAWDRIFAVNSKGIFLMTQASVEHLRKSDSPCIVNTASIAGKKGYPNMSAYCGSKFAAIGITQSLSAELAADNIRVNAICPGMVGTAMWLDHLLVTNATDTDHKTEEFENSMAQTIPLGRAQTTEDMGDAVLYLVTAPNVTGIALSVAGGFEMS